MTTTQITIQSDAGIALFQKLAEHVGFWNDLTPANRMSFFCDAADKIEETGSCEISKIYTSRGDASITISAQDLGLLRKAN